MGCVLVVEDERDLGLSIKQVLQFAGLTVDVTPSVDKALELLKQKEYDAVLLDIMMPGTPPRVFLEVLGKTPVVFCSALSPIEADKEVDLAAGVVVDYVQKPFTNANLISAVRTAMARSV